MTKLSLALVVCLGLGVELSGCGQFAMSGPQSGPHSSVPSAPTNQMLLKDPGGYHAVPLAKVQAMDVTIGPRSVTLGGNQALRLLKEINLNAPQEPGFQSAPITGQITIHYFDRAGDPEQARRLNILNNRLLQDSVYAEALYSASRLLDESWIDQ